MKIILSRKGFDSGYGGVASPILPDNSLVPLPIPSNSKGALRYDRQYIRNYCLGNLVTDLTGGRYSGKNTAHLDPDLCASTLAQRPEGWRSIFGQAGAAQSHLARAGIGPGDLFLFFGWFRRVVLRNKKYFFDPGAPNIHVIFGWLQVGEVLPGGPSMRRQAPEWAQYHTHFYNVWNANTVYLASANLAFPTLECMLPGGGLFPNFVPALCLTAPGETRSVWQLPRCFAPTKNGSIMSYHYDVERWKLGGKHCTLRTVGKGQEFIINPIGRPEILKWVKNLFSNLVNSESPRAAL